MSIYINKNSLIESIYNIESNSNLFEFKLDSIEISMWALVRTELMQSAIDREFSLSCSQPKVSMNFLKWCKYFISTLRYSAINIPTSDIIMFGSDIANIEIDDTYFNRLNEYFANVFPGETCLVESSNIFSYKKPRKYDKVYARDSITLFGLLKNKLLSKVYKKNTSFKKIDEFILFLKSNLSYKFEEGFYVELRKNLIAYEYRAPIIYKGYSNFFKRTKPKLIFLEEGCYGADSSIIIKAARMLKIHIAEIQHGYIGMDHRAYVYSPDLCKEYIQYLPNELITYGKYWSENIQIPIPTVIIGNSYLNEAKNSKLQKKLSKHILYASSAVNPKLIVNEVLQLKRILEIHDYRLTFRPHPMEYYNLEESYSLLIENGIDIDRENIYDSLGKYEYIVGSALSPSTIMYEAIAFECRPIYIYDGSFNLIKEPFFEYIGDLSEIITILLGNSVASVSQNDVWETRWKEKYKEYVSKFIN